MAFSKISKTLEVPRGATAEYTFPQFSLCDAGWPKLQVRHAGDGTPSYMRASWHQANERRMRRNATTGPERLREVLKDEARLVADHCVAGWSNVVEDDGSVPPCTPDKVFEFLCTVIESDDGITIFQNFTMWLSDAANFRAVTTGHSEALGKS